MKQYKSTLGQITALALLLCIGLLAAYSPAGLFSFGFHNDYWAWGYDTSICCYKHPEAAITAAIGRVLAAWLLGIQFVFIETLDDLRLWRIITVVTLALNAVYFHHLLRKQDRFGGLIIPLAITALVFLHKTMQLNVLWASNFVYFNIPIFVALLAAHALKASEDRSASSPGGAALFGACVALLVVALFIYPPSATFMVVPTVYGLFMHAHDARRTIRSAAFCICALVLGFALYYLSHRYLVLPALPAQVTMGTYRWDFDSEVVWTAVSRFFGFYLPEAANAWSIWETTTPGAVLIAIIALGLVASVVRRLRAGQGGEAGAEVLAAAAALAIVGFAMLPNLVAAQLATSVRVFFVPGACLVISFGWAVGRLMPHRPAALLLALTALSAGALAFINVWTTAEVAEAEHKAIGAAIGGPQSSPSREILILRSYAPRQLFALDVGSSFRPLPPIVLIGDYFIGRRYRKEARFDLSVISTKPGQPALFIEQGTTVVDLQPMLERYTPVRPVIFAQVEGRVTATPRMADNGPINLFDGSKATFWEAWGAPWPVTLEFDFTQPRSLAGYSFGSGTHEAAMRMPTAWRVWGSVDGVTWSEVDAQESRDWTDAEVREFPLRSMEALKRIRFEFLANGAGGRGKGVRLYELGFQ